MTLEVAVLVSVGRHPVSGRTRRADHDARALEMALTLRDHHGARLHVIHAGDPEQLALRDYLGMGLPDLTVLELPRGMDPVPALSAYLQDLPLMLLLTGMHTEHGLGSGQLPYALAEALGYRIVPGIAQVEPGADCAELCQALPRGRRRALRVAFPAVLSVAPVAAAPRQSAFARARRGVILRKAVPSRMHVPAPVWLERTARKRPARLQGSSGAGALDRLRAIREAPAHSGRILQDVPADEAARAILADLTETGILRT